MKPGLILTAEDATDLEVISAQLQDAVTRVRDLTYLPKSRRFVGLFNRFKWEEQSKGANLRVRAALRVETVISVKAQNLDQQAPYAVASLLAVQFTPHDPQDCAGVLTLLFSGSGTMKLEVECLDVALSDLTDAWAARGRPSHPTDEA